ncbi:MAG: Arm DNA-binding domain-containing protein [Burkholderiaceae bacterium]
MPLTDTAIRNAKSCPKSRKMFDGAGLYLGVSPAGGKWWRFRYAFGGKAKLLSMGTYPDASLTKARARRDGARKLLADDVDPGVHRKATKPCRPSARRTASRRSRVSGTRRWRRTEPTRTATRSSAGSSATFSRGSAAGRSPM